MYMVRQRTKIDDMSDDEKKELKKRLHTCQGEVCFLCGDKIDIDMDKLHIDHIVPLAEKGQDEESNWALTHAVCNDKKKVRNLRLARIIMMFENDRDNKKKKGEKFTTKDVLERFGGSKDEVGIDINNGVARLRFLRNGNINENNYPIVVDQNDVNFKSFFAMFPIEYLFHDDDLNPREIIDVSKLITEFWRKNPQLHVALGRLHMDNETKKGRVLLFDGQHKTAAQLYLGNKEILARVFVNPDKEKLKETNRRAHKELRQIEFFKSVLDELGEDIFSMHFKGYLENPSTQFKSERGYIDWVDAERRDEEKGNLVHFLKANIKNCSKPKNEFFDFVEQVNPRAKTWPISYDSVEKTFFKFFIDQSPCEIEIKQDDDGEDRYPRWVERDNSVRLMNLFVDKVLKGKYSKDLGIHKLEDRMKRGETIPDDHLRAYRLFRPRVFEVWCEFLKEAIADMLIIRRKITNDMKKKNRVLWAKIDDEDWKDIEKMVDRLIIHKIWLDRGTVLSNALIDTNKDNIKKLLEKGQVKILEGDKEVDKKILDQPIDISYLRSAIGN